MTKKNTCPANAGEKNMTPENLAKNKVKTNTDELNGKLLNRINNMIRVRQPYKGTWEKEEFIESVDKFFIWCEENDVEPCKPALQLWLACGRTQLWEWSTNPKHGFKHEAIVEAIERMEMMYFLKLDDRPVPNMFKLKTNGFGYVEQSKVEISASEATSKEDIKDAIKNIGLDN